MVIKNILLNSFQFLGAIAGIILCYSGIYSIRIAYKYLPAMYEKTKGNKFPPKLDLFGRMWILFDYLNAATTKKSLAEAKKEENFDRLSEAEIKILKKHSRMQYISCAVVVLCMIALHFLGVNFSEHP